MTRLFFLFNGVLVVLAVVSHSCVFATKHLLLIPSFLTTIVSRHEERMFFLFNDVLVVAKFYTPEQVDKLLVRSATALVMSIRVLFCVAPYVVRVFL
jgi:hypothetical protein